MAKATITIEDGEVEGTLQISVEFDPPALKEGEACGSHLYAMRLLQLAQSEDEGGDDE